MDFGIPGMSTSLVTSPDPHPMSRISSDCCQSILVLNSLKMLEASRFCMLLEYSYRLALCIFKLFPAATALSLASPQAVTSCHTSLDICICRCFRFAGSWCSEEVGSHVKGIYTKEMFLKIVCLFSCSWIVSVRTIKMISVWMWRRRWSQVSQWVCVFQAHVWSEIRCHTKSMWIKELLWNWGNPC